MKNLSDYDFEAITLQELKNQYPFPDAPWETNFEEPLFIELERKESLELISKSSETLRDPRFIFALVVDEPDQKEIDLHAKIEAKHYQRIETRTNYLNFLKEKQEELEQPKAEPFDLSDTTAVEKIIYLNELGIIDFLRAKPEFMGSVNLMATFLSAITGSKVVTLQPSLNKLFNGDTEDRNHPYRTQKTVERIKQTFINKNVKSKTS
jgi:hypothetical protein